MRQAWSRIFGVLAVCALFAVPATVEAQTGKIAGSVTDASTGQPLEGAQILLAGTGLQTLTASNGRFFLINVPPGTYAVVARRIGYQTAELRNVVVLIDVTKEVNFPLQPATTPQELEEVNVTVDLEPLVEPGVTASQTNISQAEISALPVTNIQGVLSLQAGFLQVPDNTDIVSFTESRRNTQSAIRIRGGRGGETLTLIDEVPINNFVFGGPAFDITNEAIQQVNFQRGGFEPQYGNALSGIINIATREGGTDLAGAFGWQSSSVGGALGNTPDDLLDFNLYQGFISGPVPGTADRLRFMIAGRSATGADRVLEFDDEIHDPSNPPQFANAPHGLDLFPGWRAFGYDHERDVMGKLTYYFAPAMKLNVWGVKYQRQRLPADFDYLLTGFNALSGASITSLGDSLAIGTPGGGTTGAAQSFVDVVQGSIFANRELFTARWDHTVGRWAYKATVARFNQERQTCNFFQGVCLGPRFFDINFSGQFVAPGISVGSIRGTDEFFGGERLRTWMGRLDLQSQLTDHHLVQTGVFYQTHDLAYREWRNQGVNDVFVVPQFYTAEPWDAAVYLQDRIEYDFLTVKLGARLDFGNAGGLSFVNPRDPTNGTTVRDVCNGTAPSVGATTPLTYTDPDNVTHTGFQACTQEPTKQLLRDATVQAQQDDFTESSSRTQFSPRIGVSFPLSESSQVFFNFGRFSQNPLYNNLFQNTNIGTQADGTLCDPNDPLDVKPGTDECIPTIFASQFRVSFLGNPNLLTEKTTSYEVGYTAELLRNYAMSVILFSKDQFGLTGVKEGGVDEQENKIFDPGVTYGSAIIDYTVLLNQDFQTVRGLEVSLRRRLSNYWGFNLNYSFAQATTNSPPPDRANESRDDQGDPEVRREIRSEIDQPHQFNASLFFAAGNEPVTEGALGTALRNVSASVTMSARSGFPYTPTTSFGGLGDDQLEENSGRAPGTFQVNLQASKDFTLSNVRYGVFTQIQNLFDAENCIQVFTTTGRCNAGTVDQSRRRNGNTVGEGQPSTFFDRATFFGPRRSINFGVRVSF